MKIRAVAAVIFTSAVFSSTALATSPPDGLLFAGYAPANLVGTATRCMIEAGTSTFVQNISGDVATLISFPDIYYTTTGSLGPTAYRLSGQTHLDFATTTSGRITFDANKPAYPATVYHPAFTGYSENYDNATSTLTVHLNIHLPGCTLPINATYRN